MVTFFALAKAFCFSGFQLRNNNPKKPSPLMNRKACTKLDGIKLGDCGFY